MIIRLSQLLIDFPEIAELDMNPVLIKNGNPVAVDARILVSPLEIPSSLHLVISPYLEEDESHMFSVDGRRIFIRPVKPEDAPLFTALFKMLSTTTIYYRFFGPLKELGPEMLAEGYSFDVAFTSVLKRAIRTLWIVQDEMNIMWIPVNISWRLNERHYGALQGLNKSEIAAKYGEEQVLKWRRSYDIRPPALEKTDERSPGNDPRYKHLDNKDIPLTECLKDTIERFLPYWHEVIVPLIRSGRRIIISAHGNSIRALVKYVNEISDADIVGLNIPTGVPLIYELDENLKPIKNYYLGDPDEIKRATETVSRQGKV